MSVYSNWKYFFDSFWKFVFRNGYPIVFVRKGHQQESENGH